MFPSLGIVAALHNCTVVEMFTQRTDYHIGTSMRI